MKNLFLLLTLSIFLANCHRQTYQFEQYDFELKGYNWIPNTYSFDAYIQDSIIPTKGPEVAAWEYSYIGNIQKVHESWDANAEAIPPFSKGKTDTFLSYEKTNAISYILERAKEHRVVIINEGHHLPQHRIFTTQLLEGLSNQGFNHLGLEAYFGNTKKDSILKNHGYPILTSGIYLREPQFGNMVRVANKKGYSVFGYESQGHKDAKGREIGQATNIQKYLEKHPDEKVIIHCGFAHGYEGKLNNKWEKAMAGRLNEFTGLDPLTINQTTFSERSKKELEHPYYQLVEIKEPTIFKKQDSSPLGVYRDNAWFDIAVFHPRTKKFNRPDWMIYNQRKEVIFNFENAKIEGPYMVFAYIKGEEIGNAIPYDIQETNEKKTTLVLEKNHYDIIIWNQKKEALKTELIVKN